MPAPTRRPAASESLASFGSLAFYSGGFSLPEGDYALYFDVRNFTATKKDGTPLPGATERLGVMMSASPLNGGDAQEHFYSMGSNAHLSWAPSSTGKGIVPVAGGPGSSLPRSTNWQILLESLYKSGMPEGVFDNDLSTIDGVWVHTMNVPEPEERKGFGSGAKTGENQEEEKKKFLKVIAVVTEIKDDGKPWEGKGGIPEEGAKPAKAAPKATAAAPKAAPGKKAAPPPPPADADTAGVDIEDMAAVASWAITKVLEDNPNGLPKVKLKVECFNLIIEKFGEEVKESVMKDVFSSDDALKGVLGELGYTIVGPSVKAAS